jgi:alpha-glucosidase (family GH31 glycosyl hydrolase)
MSPSRRSPQLLFALLFSAPLTVAIAPGCGGGGDGPGDAGGDVAADAAEVLGDALLDVDDDADTSAPDDVDAADTDAAEETSDDADAADAPDVEPTCEESAPGTVQEHTVAEWTIRVDDGDGSWSVVPPQGGEPVISAPPTCVGGVATVRVGDGEPRVINEFGAFRITLEGTGVATTWRDALDAPDIETGGTEGVKLDYALAGGDEVSLLFEPEGDDLMIRLAGDFRGGTLSWTLPDEESWFGLGSQVTGMDLRGYNYPLWTQEQGNGKPERAEVFPLQNIPEAAYAPMGVWHTTGGASAVIAHDAYSELDIGETDESKVTLRSWGALPGFVLVTGETPRERVTSVTRYTGRLASDPPPWTFAPWNDAVGGPARLREVAEKLRDEGIPSSVIWAEDWIGGSQTGTGYRLSYAWEWDTETYPDLPDDIAWLHDNGFAFLAYFNTFVPQPTRMWEEGVEGDYLIQREDGTPRTVQDPAFRTAGLVDLSNEDAVAWLRGYLDTAAATLGIDGWMADFTEWAPVDAVLADGTDPWLFHNRYPLLWQQVNREALEAAHAEDEATNNWTYFARSGWASVNGGSAGIAPTMWGGDQDTDWAFDDGYPTVVPIGAHLGLAGVAIFGSDVGGYNAFGGTPTTKELFFRWASMAAFHPLMRTHHGSNECANWSFDRDEETIAHYRRWASVHTLLYPLFRNLSDEAQATGLPITRHPWLASPESPWLWSGDDYGFFLGDDIYVAPVLHEGATSRLVELPADGWWPLFGDGPVTAELVEGVPTLEADAPATQLPVYVRPGTIVPLFGAAVDSFYRATPESESGLDMNTLRFALYPDSEGALREVTFEETTVSGTGWSGASVGPATFGGTAIASCDDFENGFPPCYDSAAAQLLLVGSGTLSMGGATLEVDSPEGLLLIIGVGDAVWDEFADATVLTDLDPDIALPCEEEE